MTRFLTAVLFPVIYLISSSLTFYTERKEICITVDDLPYAAVYHKDVVNGIIITENILKAFKKHNVVALGSVNGGKLQENGEFNQLKFDMLKKWKDNGQMLANHSFYHNDYNYVSFDVMTDDIIKGEKVLDELYKYESFYPRYFRHPYLHRGNTKQKADSLAYFLSARGYTEAPVTIDNYDYMFSWAYEKAVQTYDEDMKQKIGRDYMNYMKKVLKYYEKQSEGLFDRNIKHIVLTHANMLNSDYMDDLLTMYEENGYTFISIDEALKDECYRSKDEYYKNGGISWIHRWAYTRGKPKEFFSGEPDAPDYIKELAKH